MFVVSVVSMAAASGLLVYAGRRGQRGLFRATALGAATVSILLLIPTTIGFTAN
jgi:hypothetical protein